MTDRTNAAMRAPRARTRALAASVAAAVAAAVTSVATTLAMAVVLVSAGVGVMVATAPVASASPGSCGAPVPGQARVVVVVDDGEGGADHAAATCVLVPRGAKGAQVLAARAAQLGTAAPSHAGSGLLCTIDSFPASQCADTGSGSYWANFSGTDGSWDYSNYNPFIRRVCDGDVEGWRYVVRGSGAAGDAQPRLDASAVRPSDAWGCTEPSSAPAVNGGAGDPGTPAARGAAATAADSPAADGPASEPTVDPVATDSDSGSNSAAIGTARAGTSDATVLAAGAATNARAATNAAGASSWWGAGLAVVVIVALGAVAVFRSRRRA